MVGAMKLMKILHCRTHVRRIRDNSGRSISHKDKFSDTDNNSDTQIDIKIEPLAYNKNTCRICLREGNIDIFVDNNSEDLSNSIYKIAGINITHEDPYPKHLCQSCHALLQGAILFKRTALKSERILTKLGSQLNQVKDEALETCYGDANNGFTDNLDEDGANASGDDQLIKEKRKFDMQDHAENTMFYENKGQISKKTNSREYKRQKATNAKVPSKYMCDICGKFSNEYHFMKHRLTHFYDLPVKCTLCPYRGRFQESLKMHMRSHTGERPYQCEQCSARFMSKSNLNKHTLTHKAHNFRCESCCKGYYTKRELELHIQIDHTGVKAHACRYCEKSFGYRKQVMKHERKVHKREKMKSGRLIYIKLESMEQQKEAQNSTTETIT